MPVLHQVLRAKSHVQKNVQFFVCASVIIVLFSGCTTTGRHTGQIDEALPGVVVPMRVEFLVEIGEDQARRCVAHAKDRLSVYGVELVPTLTEWKRPQGLLTLVAVMNEIALRPIREDQDRTFALLKGAPLMVFGVVDDETSTRGYARASLTASHLINVMGPCEAVAHEMEHQIGCGHGLTKNRCYPLVAEMKRAYLAGSGDFLPGRNLKTGELIASRAEADRRLRAFVYGTD